MELQAEVEEQQHETERGEHLEIVRVGDEDDPGSVGAEEDAGQDEQGDGRQSDTAAEAGEDGGGEEGAAHGYERVCVADELSPFESRSTTVSGHAALRQEMVKERSVISLPNDYLTVPWADPGPPPRRTVVPCPSRC